MRAALSKAAFRCWPFPFGHVTVMEALRPPKVAADRVTTKLRRYGLRFDYNPNSEIGRYIYYRGIFEEQVLRTIEGCLQPGMTFIDVGANIGLHTVVAAKLVGSKGHVIAFEPLSRARKQATENIRLNKLTNVILHADAVGKEIGSARIHLIDGSNDGQSTLQPGDGRAHPYEDIRVVTLDAALKEIPNCVMKVDVEGGEMDVLRGAEGFIRNSRPKAIFVECVGDYLKRFGSTRRDVIAWLHSAGYETRALIRGRWVPVGADLDRDADIWATRRSATAN